MTTIITKPCSCGIETMMPLILGDQQGVYTHRCDVCNGGITYEQNDNYNRYHRFSGYDEYNDEGMYLDEQTDTY